VVHLAPDRLYLERLGKQLVDFQCFLGLQVFNRAEVQLLNERVGRRQNMLQRIKLDSVFHEQNNNSSKAFVNQAANVWAGRFRAAKSASAALECFKRSLTLHRKCGRSLISAGTPDLRLNRGPVHNPSGSGSCMFPDLSRRGTRMRQR
jgi:hypothetical protein